MSASARRSPATLAASLPLGFSDSSGITETEPSAFTRRIG